MGTTVQSDHKGRLIAIARWICALAFSTAVGACVWLAIIEEGHGGHILGSTWTSHDFPDGLGNALGAVSNVSRRGLWGTLVIAAGVVILFALVERWLPGTSWRKGISFAPIIFLLWGLVFCPLVDAKQTLSSAGEFGYLPSGLFASASSPGTIASAAVASLIAGMSIARVLQLMRTAEWWEPTPPEQTDLAEPLLELAEQRTDEGGERAG